MLRRAEGRSTLLELALRRALDWLDAWAAHEPSGNDPR
jgi:hypothetical protein